MFGTLILALALAARETASSKALAPRPTTEYVSGCPACCCGMKIPKTTSPADAIKLYCLRGQDQVCAKMCRQWLKDRSTKKQRH